MARELDRGELELKRDLTAFADPGTSVDLSFAGSLLTARWAHDDQPKEAVFTKEKGEVLVQFDGRRLNYRAFLASEGMADLKRLAVVMSRVGYGIRDYIETLAQREVAEDGSAFSPENATELIVRLASEALPWNATRVVFVKGAAGCGKTYILRKLAQDQARRYELGETDTLFFYVDAQGKALARFDEAIAKELQDLHAPFTYHAVASLTRHGCLIVIIDGFDELLGSGGYDEAFASLSNFLSQLGGEGSVIASARSTFYDYKGFRRSAQRFAAEDQMNYVVEPIDVRLWERDKVVEYFGRLAAYYPESFAEPLQVYEHLIGRMGGKNRELLQKPFYVAKIAELHREGSPVGSDTQLLAQVVDRFVEREVDKMKDSQGRPILDKDGHLRLLTDLAEEMWWQETRFVDIPTIQTLAELLAEDRHLSPTQVNAIVEKVPSNAFLSSKSKVGRTVLGFEHEVFYSFFLSRRLFRALEDGGQDLREFLSRATLPESVLEEGALVAAGRDPNEIATWIRQLGEALLQRTGEAVARENAGSVATALIQHRADLPAGLVFKNMVFKNSHLEKTALHKARFENCYIEGVDFRYCDLSGAELVNTSLHSVIVDPHSTRFDGVVLDLSNQLFGLIVYTRSGKERINYPTEIAANLKRVGAVPVGYETAQTLELGSEVKERIELVDRFLRYAQRTFYISSTEPRLRTVFGSREWPTVLKLLRQHGLVERAVVQKSGPKQDLMKLRFPPDMILDGLSLRRNLPAEILAFWKDIGVSGT